MKKAILLLHFTFCVFYFADAQTAPGIQWQNTIGGINREWLYAIQQTADLGYILGGASESNISGDKTENSNGTWDYWMVKIDATGNILWQNTIGGSNPDIIYCIQQTYDGGYVLGGASSSGISGDKAEICNGASDYWVIKTDSMGNIQWQNTIGGNDTELLCSIQQTSDGGYILGGFSDSGISGDKTENNVGLSDYWIIKIDSMGNIQWQNTIGGSLDDQLNSIHQTTDGGYILGGHSWSNISGDKTENSWNSLSGLDTPDYWMVKTDASGNIQWQNTLGGGGSDAPISIQQTTDTGYILGGHSNSNISGDKTENCIGYLDYWIVKTDSLGNIQWQNTVGGNSYDYLRAIQQAFDGGYILGGSSSSNISGDKTENCIGDNDYWIIKTDTVGNIQWENTIGGSDIDELYSLQQTIDGGYFLGGYSHSNISGDKTENSNGISDYWIVKLYPDTITSTTNPTPTSGIQIFPNPVTDELTINLNYPNPSITPITITVTDIMGKQIFTTRTTTSNFKLQTLNYPKGMYFINVVGQKINATKKFAKE